MTVDTPFAPDRWLLCGAGSAAALRRRSRSGLLSVRLRQGWIEPLEAGLLPQRLIQLAVERCRTVVMVFDSVDDTVARLLDDIAASPAAALLDLRVLEWRSAPAEVVAGASCPDQDLLERLLDDQLRAGHHLSSTRWPDWWPDYEAALDEWEAAERADPDSEYGLHWQALGIAKLPWRSLVASGNSRGGAANAPLYEVRLDALAAASRPGRAESVRLSAPAASGEQFSLTIAPVIGQSATYLVFEAHAAAVQRYQGRRISIRMGGRTHDLGRVGADGIADVRIEGPLDSAADVTVQLGPDELA